MAEATSPHNDGVPFHTYAFWLYTVIVGLAIEDALGRVLPHVTDVVYNVFLNVGQETAIQFFRLALFLLLIVRFFLGSVHYFNEFYLSSDSAEAYPTCDYKRDFFFGLIHFSAFLGLAQTIGTSLENKHFLLWLSGILLYDFVWWFGSIKLSTVAKIRLWAFINGITFALSVASYFLVREILVRVQIETMARRFWCEAVAILVVGIISLVDIREVFKLKPDLYQTISDFFSPKKGKF